LPHVEVLLDAVDLDRLEHDVDRGRAEEPARRDDESQAEPAPDVQAGEMLEPEELLPEGDVAGLVRDQGLEHRVQARRGNRQERPVEREVEDLVENEAPSELGVRVTRRRGPSVPAAFSSPPQGPVPSPAPPPRSSPA